MGTSNRFAGWGFGHAGRLARAACAVLLVGPAAWAQPKAATGKHAEPPSVNAVLRTSNGYKLEKGPYEVGSVGKLVLHDDKRNKDLEMTVRFPKTKENGRSFPLVVFSHGAGGNREAFAELSSHWASYGYVVIHPTHSDSIKLRREHGEKFDVREEMKNIVKRVDPPDRMADVAFILDSLDSIEGKVDGLKGKAGHGRIDRSQIGMAGHSAGAYTTQIAAGVKVRGARWGGLEIKNHGDSRIKCAVVISGQGLTNLSLTKDSWSDVTLPMLVITGSQDISGVSNETPASRRQPFELAKPGDKYLIYIEGATHSSYAGKATSVVLGEKPTTDIHIITDTVAAGTLAFLDRYLKSDENAGAYLGGDGLGHLSDGKAKVERK